MLKLQYTIIGQRLAMIKVQKAISRQQQDLNKEANVSAPVRAQQLGKQIDQLLDVIKLGDWQGTDKQLMETYKANLCGQKRKLAEENEMVGEEVRKLLEERQKFEEYKISERAKLKRMMEDLKKQKLELKEVAEPRKLTCADNDDSVQFIGMEAPSLQLPQKKRRRAEPVGYEEVEPDDVLPS